MSQENRSLPIHPGGESPKYWRSLEELAGTPEFERFLRGESSEEILAEATGLDRRDLFKFLGVSFALAGLTACTRQPAEKIVPYVRQPEEVIPGGKPLFFATSMTLSGRATGLLIESHTGRPTKAEGNPLHPASLGASDFFAQASLYGLYDPDRSQTLTYLDEIRPWPAFLGAMRLALEAERPSRGAGLRFLTETVCSPTLVAQMEDIAGEFPAAKWISWEPVNRDAAFAGARSFLGADADVLPRVDRAEVILSLGADFLACGPGHLKHARDFAARRRELAAGGPGVRLYVVESSASVTGANADHRRPTRASEMDAFVNALAGALGGSGVAGGGSAFANDPFVTALVRDLSAHRGKSLVLAGETESPAAHALAHAMNAALNNWGETIFAIDPIEVKPGSQLTDLSQLVKDMNAGRVSTLVMLGGNPVYDAPADLNFAAALEKVKLRVHQSLYQDETSVACHWHVPAAHYLESWSDARAFDGTASIVQPLIAPLYDGKSAHEVLAAFSPSPERSGYELVRATWQKQMKGDFESSWRKALHDGVIEGTAFAPRAAKPAIAKANPAEITSEPLEEPPSRERPAPSAPSSSLEIVFRPDPKIYDGRFANNGWLQELPHPITKLTWDNAALVSLATAERLGLRKEDLVDLTYRGASVRAPVWIEPGLPDNSVTVYLGYGRTRAGHFGNGSGFDAYRIRPSTTPWWGSGVELAKTGERRELACTQLHQNMEGRELVRAATVEEFRRNPKFVYEHEKPLAPEMTLYPHYPSDTYAWGMAIDLNSCIGCNACVVACQAENNIPIVGKDQVHRGREMQWLRIDHYYGGDPANPQHFYQPIPCMHCEKAPCEQVCPVAATVHSAEGLNDMVYNRCVGTKYCSNNCPYKVRHFNFYHYSTQFRAPSMKMLANPDVTVRWRGVMEKCTYCVQRITSAKIDADIGNRRVRDGEITPACAQACPAQAIVFGDLADGESRVSKLRRDPRNYPLLEELGTRPRTTYLGALRNPNPALKVAVSTEFPSTELDRETGQK